MFDYAAKKRNIVRWLLIFSAVYGIVGLFIPEEESGADFLVVLPLIFLAVAWCYADASQRGARIPRWLSIVMVLFFIVGFPIYLSRTRGAAAVRTLGLALLLMLAMAMTAVITAVAVAEVLEALGFAEFSY